jgi:CheY-like chemotaxis protein
MIKPKILLVEYDSIITLQIKHCLQSWGYPIPITVQTGKEAIKTAYKINPDIIIVNTTLKGEINGLKTLQKIIKLKIPIILLTSQINQKPIKKLEKTQKIILLPKPFTENDLKEAIESISI